MTENIEFIQRQIAFTLDELVHQAHSGGKNEPHIERHLSKAGPYWQKEMWEKYCERVKKHLLEYGYPEDDAQKKIAEATTQVKFIE